MAGVLEDYSFVCLASFLIKVEVLEIIQLSHKEGTMRTKKQLIVCLTACIVLCFVAAVYAAPPDIRAIPVTVNNTNSKPIPVTEVNKYPIQRSMGSPFAVGKCWSDDADMYTVPPDKRLVIEYFSCFSFTYPNTALLCSIKTSLESDVSQYGGSHFLPITPFSPPPSVMTDTVNIWHYLSAGQQVQIYADPGTKVNGQAYRTQTTGTCDSAFGVKFQFSGYLIDQ
jgi:hypothetical protein